MAVFGLGAAIVLLVGGAVAYRALQARRPETAIAPDIRPGRVEATATVPAAPASPSSVHVVVYTTAWCPVCKRAKAWMVSHGVAYEERDIETSSDNARKVHAINPRGSIPTFDIEGDVMVGFSEEMFGATMQRAAQRQAARRQL